MKRAAFLGLFRWRPQGLWVRVCDANEFVRVEMLLTSREDWPGRVARAQSANAQAPAHLRLPAPSEFTPKSAGACAFAGRAGA